MFKLRIIITSSRPGRKGPAIARWVLEESAKHPEFQTEIIDLAEINLPFMDEPNHPRFHQYQHEHTKRWSALVDEADAFIIVAAEYNYGFTAVFKNAIDYLHEEWKHKPAGIVSYGGVAAGTRAAQMMKQVLTSLSMMPLFEAVNIPMFVQFFDKENNFRPNEVLQKSCHAMFSSLARWTEALSVLRKKGESR